MASRTVSRRSAATQSAAASIVSMESRNPRFPLRAGLPAGENAWRTARTWSDRGENSTVRQAPARGSRGDAAARISGEPSRKTAVVPGVSIRISSGLPQYAGSTCRWRRNHPLPRQPPAGRPSGDRSGATRSQSPSSKAGSAQRGLSPARYRHSRTRLMSSRSRNPASLIRTGFGSCPCAPVEAPRRTARAARRIRVCRSMLVSSPSTGRAP
jgi:hypothetical protein